MGALAIAADLEGLRAEAARLDLDPDHAVVAWLWLHRAGGAAVSRAGGREEEADDGDAAVRPRD